MFYTGVGIGFEADEDNKMWQIHNPTGTEDLTIEPHTQSLLPTPSRHLILDSEVILWPSLPSTTGSVVNANVVTWDPTFTMNNSFGTLFTCIKLNPIVTHDSQVAIGTFLSAGGTQTNTVTALFAATFSLFFCNTTFRTETANGVIMPATIFRTDHTIATVGVTATCAEVGGQWSRSFSSSPRFHSSGAGGQLTVDRFTGLDMGGGLNTIDADGSVTVTEWNEFETMDLAFQGSGTNEVVTRNALKLADDTNSTNVNGILSAISSGANKKFINHTGTAVSFFGAAIEASAFNLTAAETYTTSDFSVDRTIAAGTDGLEAVADVLATLIEDLKTAGILT
jgi:hypothetical protein